MIGHLVLIGVGLIGGSLSLALRRAGKVHRVTGVARHASTLNRAKERGIIDDARLDAAEAVRDADMVLLAVPMRSYAPVFDAIREAVSDRCIVTDAGSTKQYALDMAHRHLANPAMFVPAHPIAGTEQSGPDAAFADLFTGRLCVLTPEADTDPQAVDRVARMWESVGCRIVRMAASDHDDFLAAVSHLPHLAAYALVNAVRRSQGKDEDHDPFRFAAGGFRDFSRIASSSPEMWRDIALSNRQALLRKIDDLQQELSRIRQALEKEDGEWLLQSFSEAKQARDAWLKTHGGDV